MFHEIFCGRSDMNNESLTILVMFLYSFFMCPFSSIAIMFTFLLMENQTDASLFNLFLFYYLLPWLLSSIHSFLPTSFPAHGLRPNRCIFTFSSFCSRLKTYNLPPITDLLMQDQTNFSCRSLALPCRKGKIQAGLEKHGGRRQEMISSCSITS